MPIFATREHFSSIASPGSLLGVTVGARVHLADAKLITKRFARLGDTVRRKIIKVELQRWAKETRAEVRAATPVRTGRLKRDIATKIRTYKGGLVFWAAVGGKSYKTAKGKERLGKDYLGAGWRLHFITGPVRRHRGGPKKGKRLAAFSMAQRSERRKANVGYNYLERIAKQTRARAWARIRLAMRMAVNQ